MIDICPVGALTSKPFRYSARTWELSRRKSVSPHDSTGANLIVQVKNNKVMRVVPLENEDVNECWIADRDRFSYEALNSDERLTTAHAQAGRRVEDRRLADRARIRGQRPEADQGRPWRRQHRHAGQPAQHAGRAVPGRRAGARPGQRQHRLPPAQRRIRQRADRRALAGHLDRIAVAAAARAGGRLQPAQGPSAVRAAHPPGRPQGRAAECYHFAANCSRDAWAMPRGQRCWPSRRDWAQALADVAAAIARRKGRDRAGRRPGDATPPRPSPSRCWAASARPSCWAMPPRTMPRPPACWRWPTGSARRPAPASAT